jgi:hypothetical protein
LVEAASSSGIKRKQLTLEIFLKSLAFMNEYKDSIAKGN